MTAPSNPPAFDDRPMYEAGSCGGNLYEHVFRTPWFVAHMIRDTTKGRLMWTFTIRDRVAERKFMLAARAKP